jgi:hypothetical protein
MRRQRPLGEGLGCGRCRPRRSRRAGPGHARVVARRKWSRRPRPGGCPAPPGPGGPGTARGTAPAGRRSSRSGSRPGWSSPSAARSTASANAARPARGRPPRPRSARQGGRPPAARRGSLAAADRTAVGAGGKPRLGPLQPRPPGSQELVDGHAGLRGVAPVGVVDLIAELGGLRSPGVGLQQPLEPGALASQQHRAPPDGDRRSASSRMALVGRCHGAARKSVIQLSTCPRPSRR